MKKILLVLLLLSLVLGLCACDEDEDYSMNESTFFRVMTNIQYYPEQYVGKQISYDCFTYRLVDVSGNEYLCGVRKCSSGYGCTCGNDTIIGFILDYDGEIPEPKNQSEDTPDKTWVHLVGTLENANQHEIKIYAYKNGAVDYSAPTETVVFCRFKVSSLTLIEDYSGLAYYVTK